MTETLSVSTGTRAERYQTLLPQIEALITGEPNLIANLANICAALRETFGFHWIGFYLMENSDVLVLGPFQGPIACTRIPLSKGVCGAAAREQRTLIVPDVNQFSGHIACSSLSRSEIVLPLLTENGVQLVLDIDSSEFDDFSTIDQINLEEILHIVRRQHFNPPSL